jgi:hypothetical protein
MRTIGLGGRGWVFIGAAVVLAGMSVVVGRLWLPGALASGVGAAIVVVTGVWVSRGTSSLATRDDQRRAVPGRVYLNRHGRLPLVQEFDDPVVLGVHPAAGPGRTGMSRCPPLIARDFGPSLPEILRRDRFVLLVGESTAGKSRAAYELISAELAGYRLVQPCGRDAVLEAARIAADTPRAVLWLDDLERFLGSGGLTGASVQTVLNAGGSARYIVATMRSEEYAKFSGRAPGLESMSRDVLRQGWDVLRLAARVEVPRMWSAAEITRARLVQDDLRLAEAVRHAGEFGVAEYLAAAPQLLAEWRDAWAPGCHPRGAALVHAAVDARRAGVHRPLPLPVLLQMHEPYLERAGGSRLRPESVEEAVTWATTALYATSSLLLPEGDGFLAFDYLIDAVGKDRVPGSAIEALVAFAVPAEALDIGQIAWSWSLIGPADSAFRRAEAGGLFEGTERRCGLIDDSNGGTSGALRFAEVAAQWTEAVHGPTLVPGR